MRIDGHDGPYTRRQAHRRLRANYRRWARLNGLQWDEELGGTVGKQHGSASAVPRALRVTRRRRSPVRSASDPAQWYVPLDAVDQTLPDGSEDIDGASTPVTRTGRVLAPGTLREYDPADPDDGDVES